VIADARVARLDLRTGRVAKVSTGSAPRSLAMAPDGRALYVVNYASGTVSKVRASNMRVMQTVAACHHPIGIT
jgi:YVTN family beta-propeller protein